MGNQKSIGVAYSDQDLSGSTLTNCTTSGGTVSGASIVGSPTDTLSATGGPNEIQLNGNSQVIEIPITFTATDISRRVFIALRACRVKSARSAFATASSSGTWTVEKTPSGTAPGSGTALLTGAVALSGTANTTVAGTLIATQASLTLAAGDALSIVIAGTMTNLVGGMATIGIAPL